jgi:hypothetical protein
MLLKFKTYSDYLKYLSQHGTVESDKIEQLMELKLLIKEKTIDVEGYEAVGFRIMSESEFNVSSWKKKGIIDTLFNGDK